MGIDATSEAASTDIDVEAVDGVLPLPSDQDATGRTFGAAELAYLVRRHAQRDPHLHEGFVRAHRRRGLRRSTRYRPCDRMFVWHRCRAHRDRGRRPRARR